MSLKDIPLEKFISSPQNILEMLYQEPDTSIEARTYEQFLNLPVNENYKKNKLNNDNICILKNNSIDNLIFNK